MANDWLDSYGVNGLPSINDILQQRQMQQVQREAAIQQMVERERQMQALNSPFVRQLMGDMTAQPSPNVRPSFGPGMPGAVNAADVITPRYPSAMGVDMPPGSRGSGPRINPRGMPSNSQARVHPEPDADERGGKSDGDADDVKLTMDVGEIQRTPAGGKPPEKYPRDAKGRRVIEISGANWVDDKPKPERALLGGRVDPRALGLHQRQPGKPQAPEQMTPEQYAIFQQLAPQLTQRRVAQEQATSAEDRKYAELDLKNRNAEMTTGFNIWKTSVETATKLRLAEQKLRAAATRPGANRLLRDLVPAMANIRGQLEGESNRLAVMLQNGYGVSQNPAEQQAVRSAQMRIAELMQSADAVTMQYTDLYNQSYSTTVPTLKPTSPVPQAPPGQGRAPAQPGKGPLTPAAEAWLRANGG